MQFEIDARPTRLSECNCSLCTKKGARYVPVAEIQSLTLTAGESELSAYRFGTNTATHYFCRHCGVHTFHRPRLDPARWSVNARCLTDLDSATLPITHFDGQHWEAAARAETGRG